MEKQDKNNKLAQKPKHYSKLSGLSLEDQKWTNEYFDKKRTRQSRENKNTSVNGSDNGICYPPLPFKLTKNKRQAIDDLKKCNYRTPPRKIAKLLEEFFTGCHSKSSHWLYIAQNWPPRPINQVLDYIIKGHLFGQITMKNPAAFFTFLIKKRAKRKAKLADTIGTYYHKGGEYYGPQDNPARIKKKI